MGSMPPMTRMAISVPLEIRATGEKTNLLDFTCERYEIDRHGEKMEIWATSQLGNFQVYLDRQPLSIGPPILEERWSELMAERKLFPLLASVKLSSGLERYRFEVNSIHAAKLSEKDEQGFQTPQDYFEIMPRPF